MPDPLVADPEAVRSDPTSGNPLWVSEGDRALTATPQRIINPFIREVRTDGTHVREYTLPPMFQMSASDTGPRGNAVFDRASGIASAQYAYPIEKVQAQPSPAGAFTVNGPTEILALSNTRFLLLDFETLKAQLGGIANLEDMTCGPRLANGRDSLVVVADDNFPAADSATDRNQFLVFEVLP